MRWLCAALLLTWLAPAQAELPHAFSATFQISRGLVGGGTGELHFERDGGRYQLSSSTRAGGLLGLIYRRQLNEYSHGEALPDGSLRPQEYLYQRLGSGAREARLRFDWERGQVINDVGGPVWRLAIPAGTKDRLLAQVAVMRDLARGQRSMAYPIADGGELRTLRLVVEGKETVDTPAGRFDTLRVRHQPDDAGGEPVTTFWCAPALNYLPVRLTHRDADGRTYEMLLQAYALSPVK